MVHAISCSLSPECGVGASRRRSLCELIAGCVLFLSTVFCDDVKQVPSGFIYFYSFRGLLRFREISLYLVFSLFQRRSKTTTKL